MKSRIETFLLAVLLGIALVTELRAQVPGVISYQGHVQVNGTNFTGVGQFKFALVDAGSNAVRQATASAVVSGGFLIDYNVTDGGAGYFAPPAVIITDATGSGATATAQISGGVVTDIVANAAGSGYSPTPTVTIAPPAPNVVFQSYWSNDGTSSAGAEPTDAVSVAVQDGLFTVLLGDTNLPSMTEIPSAAFGNRNVYLRIWFDDGVQGFAQLSPDQRLTAAGYAMRADQAQIAVEAASATAATQVPWAGITGVPAGFADGVDHNTTYNAGTGLNLGGTTFSIANNGVAANQLATDAAALAKITGNSLRQVGTDVGVNETTPAARLHVTEGDTGGTAIRGETTSTVNTATYGVHGIVSSRDGAGVFGESLSAFSSSAILGAGVHGRANSTFSPGVLGETAAENGMAIRAQAQGSARYGLYSDQASTNTLTYGVYSINDGQPADSQNRTRGVFGYAQGNRARGVWGQAFGTQTNATTELVGVYGLIGSPGGYAIYSDGNFGASGTKSFIQPHPTDPSLAIQFVSLEGNEAGTYFRGTAALSGGVAEIPIPEEWQLVSEANGVTVQVTPLGPARLYVAERSRERIVVRGDVDCDFDYFVNGVRRGFADHQSFIPNTAFKPSIADIEYGKQWPKALREVLVANGTLKSDYTPNESTADDLNWKLAKPQLPTQGISLKAGAERSDVISGEEIAPEGDYFLLLNQ